MSASKSFPRMFAAMSLILSMQLGCSRNSSPLNPEIIEEIEYSSLEFREDGLWYEKGAKEPFSGHALRFHDNGKRSWSTQLKDGIPKGRVLQWDEEGNAIWP